MRFSDSDRIQTCNLLIRSQMLYSVELRSPRKQFIFSDSDRIQTCNLLIRSQMLYSVELRSQSPFVCDCKVTTKFYNHKENPKKLFSILIFLKSKSPHHLKTKSKRTKKIATSR